MIAISKRKKEEEDFVNIKIGSSVQRTQQCELALFGSMSLGDRSHHTLEFRQTTGQCIGNNKKLTIHIFRDSARWNLVITTTAY